MFKTNLIGVQFNQILNIEEALRRRIRRRQDAAEKMVENWLVPVL